MRRERINSQYQGKTCRRGYSSTNNQGDQEDIKSLISNGLFKVNEMIRSNASNNNNIES